MVSYTLIQRSCRGKIATEPCSQYMVGAWMTMSWYNMLNAGWQRGYAVASENGVVARGYYRP